jgi:hypothetical protein
MCINILPCFKKSYCGKAYFSITRFFSFSPTARCACPAQTPALQAALNAQIAQIEEQVKIVHVLSDRVRALQRSRASQVTPRASEPPFP